MINPTTDAIMNLYQDELKHMAHRENIEDNEREILCPKFRSVPNTGVNGSSEWKS